MYLLVFVSVRDQVFYKKPTRKITWGNAPSKDKRNSQIFKEVPDISPLKYYKAQVHCFNYLYCIFYV